MKNLKILSLCLSALMIVINFSGCADPTDNSTTSQTFITTESGSICEEISENTEPGEISWEEALQILNCGLVKSVLQTHDLDVTLVLKDDRVLSTIEPGIDDIFDEIDKCGEPCEGIMMATE